jgi:hypothetical protein
MWKSARKSYILTLYKIFMDNLVIYLFNNLLNSGRQ